MNAAGTAAPPPTTVTAEPQDDASYVFDGTQVRTFEIEVSPENLAMLDANPAAEQYVTGTLKFEGKTYEGVGVRYKGSKGSFLVPCTAATSLLQPPGPKTGKCSIKIDIDHTDAEARFFGMKKVQLQAMARDTSLLRERLSYGLYREMGVAAPRTSHARVLINGQLEGVFLLVEQIDGRFTRPRFPDGGKGNLYKEVWPLYTDASTYVSALETNEDDNPSVDNMLAFQRDLAAGMDSASRWLDRDYTLSYLAVDRVLMNDDGVMHWYCGGALGANPGPVANHNYYWYEATDSARFWLVPWDLDNALDPAAAIVHITSEWSATPASCECTFDISGSFQRAPACDPLIANLALWRADYDQRVEAFLAGPFAAPAVQAKLEAWTQQLQPFVEEAAGLHGAGSKDDFLYAVHELGEVIDSAREHRGYAYPAP